MRGEDLRRGRVGALGAAALCAAACTTETQPLEASDDYLPLAGGHVTGALTMDGRLGVGTQAPEYSLHVSSAEPVVAILQSQASAAALRLKATGGEGREWSVESAFGKFQISDATANVDRIVISPDGHVGLGVVEPASWLHVRGDASPLGDDGIRVDRDGQCGQYQYAALSYRGGSARLTSTVINGPGVCASIGKGGFSFTAKNADGPVDRMTIDGEGKVGIGTATPSAALEVVGTVKATAFEPPSSRTLKRDIEYLSARDYDGTLAALDRLDAARYRYNPGLGSDDRTRLGFIAEDLPPEVLSADGKAVDLYELVTFVAAATKAVDRQRRQAVDELRAENGALRERVRTLEVQVAAQRDVAARLSRLEAELPTRRVARRAP